ncbi:L-threonine 3-dehydrogenase [Kallotenue papyrolyticum]|uniref:L-threonine 3-dehydrogenase n=1 Tax=Kallotenue papyrolyticum TaxID=1325125 RepID=UPI0004B5CD2E|nr:L-threonine 3-dehydrogenase [Kallotenue papyrolyticum]
MIPETMRAVVKARAAAGAELQTVPVPTIGPQDVLVRVRAATICGTDLHIYRWDRWAQSRIRPPMVFGHEFAGDVVAVGSEVSTVQVGDFISGETHIVCGACYQCRTGQYHICRRVQILGVDRPGCFAEYVALPASNAWRNDPGLDPAVAAAQEPFGNAVHTALSTDLATKSVLITGCGPIGLFAVGIARAAGASRIFATDVNPQRLEMARMMGATDLLDARGDVVGAIMAATAGEGVDVLLEMSGHPAAIDQGFAALRYGGYAALLGLPGKPLEHFDLANHIVFKGATVYGVSGRKMYETWYRTRELVTTGRVDIAPIITHRLPLEAFAEAFEMMIRGEAAKVALLPQAVA